MFENFVALLGTFANWWQSLLRNQQQYLMSRQLNAKRKLIVIVSNKVLRLDWKSLIHFSISSISSSLRSHSGIPDLSSSSRRCKCKYFDLSNPKNVINFVKTTTRS